MSIDEHLIQYLDKKPFLIQNQAKFFRVKLKNNPN